MDEAFADVLQSHDSSSSAAECGHVMVYGRRVHLPIACEKAKAVRCSFQHLFQNPPLGECKAFRVIDAPFRGSVRFVHLHCTPLHIYALTNLLLSTYIANTTPPIMCVHRPGGLLGDLQQVQHDIHRRYPGDEHQREERSQKISLFHRLGLRNQIQCILVGR